MGRRKRRGMKGGMTCPSARRVAPAGTPGRRSGAPPRRSASAAGLAQSSRRNPRLQEHKGRLGFFFSFFFFFLSFEHQPHEEEEETRPRSTLVSKQKLRGRGGFGGRRLAAPWTCSGARWDPDPKPLWAAPGLIPQDPQTRLGCIWADPTRCPPPIPMGRLSPCGELWGKGALSSPHLPTGAWPAAAQRADFYFIF